MNPFSTRCFHLLKFCALVLMAILCGCSQQKEMMAEARKLEDAGMLQAALTNYQTIHTQFESNDAVIGMHRVCQQLLQQKCTQAASMCLSGQHAQGLALFEEAKRFHAAHLDLEIEMPAQVVEQVAQCKSNYIDQLLHDAEAAVMSMELERASELIDKVYMLDYHNTAAKSLSALIKVIPLYNEGQKAYDLELWQQSYEAFNQVCHIDAGYRDSKAKRDQALINGRITMAYIVKDGVAPAKVALILGSYIKGELLELDNPFLELLERSDLEILIREQQSSLSAEFDGDGGPEAGKFRRASYLLYGEIITYKVINEPERVQKCDCASTMRIHSEKVVCFEYSQRRSVEMSLRFQLVDAESGKIFMADVIQALQADTGNRYDFQVDKKISLTSPTLQREHEVDLTGMKKPKEDFLQSENELNDLVSEMIALEIAKRMADFHP